MYRSGSRKKASSASESPAKNGASPSSAKTNGKTNSALKDDAMDTSDHEDEEEDEEDDGTLLTVQPGFNRLLLVLRDEKVMRFVKYVSAAAEGSRWDVCGEYEIGLIEEEDDE